jgi:hypothetical protein
MGTEPVRCSTTDTGVPANDVSTQIHWDGFTWQLFT